MGPGEIYLVSRTRLLDLAPELTPDELAAPLLPTPPWTVLDGYRHLAGVCTDVLDGQLPPPGDDAAWAAAQLAARADWSVDEVCAEWADRGPELDEVVAEAGRSMGFVALDCWTHEQDLRAAVGVGALHDDELIPGVLDLALGAFGRRYSKGGGPRLRLVVDGEERTIGVGEVGATLTTTPYELLRTIFGRRSQAQIAAADWSGPAVPDAQAAIHLFDLPEQDLTD
ncbi:MAG: maleylpyruvate isomerase family mycothiol-dependent enzyme [Acidimicrobiales bacterium]